MMGDQNKGFRFVRYGDLVILDQSSLLKLNIKEDEILDEQVDILKKRFKCKRIAIKSYIQNDAFRTPTVRVFDEDPWAMVVENKIKYSFDITRSMFCKANIKEKLRLAKLNCENEIVVDLFAGIGYFSLVFAVHAKAKHVYCCEWNPRAIEALRRNVELNNVIGRITILSGDNRQVAPKQLAQRVNMGLIPSSVDFLPTACSTLDPASSKLYLHVHENVNYYPQNCDETSLSKQELISLARQKISKQIVDKVKRIMSDLYPSIDWLIEVANIVCVKQYAPHIDHLVFDIHCSHR